MVQVKKSEYIIISRVVCRTLYKTGCFGKGSMYFDNLSKGLSDRELPGFNISKDKVREVIDALIKQMIIVKKKKQHGWKYYLNMGRIEKIREIVKETGRKSIIPVLLMFGK